MKRLVIAEPAAQDLEDIVDYIALDNPVAAEKVYRGIATAAERLPSFQHWDDRVATPRHGNLACPAYLI